MTTHFVKSDWNLTACFRKFKVGWKHLYLDGKIVESPRDVTDDPYSVTCEGCLESINRFNLDENEAAP